MRIFSTTGCQGTEALVWQPVDARDSRQCLVRLTQQQQAHRRLGMRNEHAYGNPIVAARNIVDLVVGGERGCRVTLVLADEPMAQSDADVLGVRPGFIDSGHSSATMPASSRRAGREAPPALLSQCDPSHLQNGDRQAVVETIGITP